MENSPSKKTEPLLGGKLRARRERGERLEREIRPSIMAISLTLLAHAPHSDQNVFIGQNINDSEALGGNRLIFF